MIRPFRLLRWLYLGRLVLAAGIFAGALLVWPRMTPQTTLLATLVLLLSLAMSLGSVWYTDVLERQPGTGFHYLQVTFDTLLVTAVVHLTGGGDSEFAPLYILVIASAGLLVPLPGGMLIGALASVVYFTDIVWGHETMPAGAVFVQIGIFAGVALVTGYLGDRLRQAGTALGAIRSELRQLRLDTREMLRTIDTGVVTVDEQGRLVYLNAAAESLLGIREGEWMGRPVLEELDVRVPGLGNMIRKTSETRTPVRWYETRVLPARGAGGRPKKGARGDEAPAGRRVFGGRTTVLERDHEPGEGGRGRSKGRAGGQPWVTAVFQDITDRKRVEELNRRAERLQAVASLSASLAHEIKNPLASIRSAVEQLSGSDLVPADRDVLERLVLTESDRLSRLLSEFLEFSRVEVRRHATVNLAEVAADAIRLVEQHPDASGQPAIDYQVPGEPIYVQGDEDLLHRAVFNLVLNAVQHGGGVSVRVGRATEDELPTGVQLQEPVRVVVRDEGPGIAAEDVPHIFDPFFSRRRGGAGLGLALVHRMVEAHNGAIFVDTAPGLGAQFTVYLPAHSDGSA